MCNFYWKLCFCCHACLYSYNDSKFCGSVDCNVNYIFPKMSTKYCQDCVNKECNYKKDLCTSITMPEKFTVDKSMRSLTLFLGPGIKTAYV